MFAAKGVHAVFGLSRHFIYMSICLVAVALNEVQVVAVHRQLEQHEPCNIYTILQILLTMGQAYLRIHL